MRFAQLALPAMLVGALASCKGGPETGKTAEGYPYTLDVHQDGARKAQNGDYITFHATYRTQKDSLLGSSHKDNMPYSMKLDTTAIPGRGRDPFMSAYLAVSQGDSGRFEIPTDSLFKGAPPSQRPPFFPVGSKLKLGLKVLRVESQKEMDARLEKELPSYASKGKYQKLENNVYVEITQAGSGATPVAGDTLTVHYTGLLADTMISKKPFDSSINPPQPGRPVEPFKLVYKAGMVIPGWDIAFGAIQEGAKARILIPYQMAYGAQGAPGAIPPFSNLIFDVQLLKVTKPVAQPAAKEEKKK